MPISYSIGADNTVIHEVWVDDISIKDLKEYWAMYLRDPNVINIRRTLVETADT